jgi:hypothetical protein
MEHRAWMYGIRRNSSIFLTELTNFLEVAQKLAQISRTKQIHCLCCDCCNKIVWEDINAIKIHLIKRGFVKDTKLGPTMVKQKVLSTMQTSASGMMKWVMKMQMKMIMS